MKKDDVIAFFNHAAPDWDEKLIKNESTINTILNYGGVSHGKRILDVACGTGVLFPYYLERNVSSITGVDISDKMIEIAKEKYGDNEKIELITGAVENISFENKYDCCVVYNALPHFIDEQMLIKCLSKALVKNGRLTIAHGMNRERINLHHSGSASKVSKGLISIETLSELLATRFEVDVKVSNADMYVASGIKL